jgi:hypothetical protein
MKKERGLIDCHRFAVTVEYFAANGGALLEGHDLHVGQFLPGLFRLKGLQGQQSTHGDDKTADTQHNQYFQTIVVHVSGMSGHGVTSWR